MLGESFRYICVYYLPFLLLAAPFLLPFTLGLLFQVLANRISIFPLHLKRLIKHMRNVENVILTLFRYSIL